MSIACPKSYLLTGGSGFLGAMIRDKLLDQGCIVTTLGRSKTNDIRCDLAKGTPTITKPFDIVIHNAGKAHLVPKTYGQKKEFADVNVAGTENLLLALQVLEKIPEAVVFISTIAVYGVTRGENITEDHPLEANDPYGRTKIQAEGLIREWCSQYDVSLTILRLPLIIGSNPPGNLGAMIRAMRKGLYVSIAGGKAKKSMVLAEDVASFIPAAANNPGTYNLTDGYHPCFRELELLIAKQADVKAPSDIPYWTARLLGLVGDVLDGIFPGKSPVTSNKIEKLVSTLTFDDERARRIGWQPREILKHFQIQ